MRVVAAWIRAGPQTIREARIEPVGFEQPEQCVRTSGLVAVYARCDMDRGERVVAVLCAQQCARRADACNLANAHVARAQRLPAPLDIPVGGLLYRHTH